jgi:VIT1/CCC1 family predicted Fe2+/Mn2+ transporter
MVSLSGGMGATELEHVRQWIIGRSPQDAPTARMTGTDLRGALGVFLLVFASTFPVVLPFIFMGDLVVAKRLSAAIAIGMLFLCGHNWGRYAGLKPAWVGVTMVVLGILIEAVVIALGG